MYCYVIDIGRPVSADIATLLLTDHVLKWIKAKCVIFVMSVRVIFKVNFEKIIITVSRIGAHLFSDKNLITHLVSSPGV